MNLREKLKLVPENAGVYLFKDKEDRILYIGKALSLKKRVKSYFQKGEFSPRIGALISRMADMEWIVTKSEAEAFLLESNLIKYHRPKYNIRFRDDKSYPYLKITTNESFPRVFLTRNPSKDGAVYFGPYANVKAARKTLRLIQRLFPLRRCKENFKNRVSPCLNFYIQECSAPCVGKISKEDYGFLVKGVLFFVQGQYASLIFELKGKMLQAAQNQEFEQATKLRDAIRAIERMGQVQNVSSFPGKDVDMIAIARQGKEACAVVFPIRAGHVVDRNHFLLDVGSNDTSRDIVTSFIKQYYVQNSFLPSRIVIPEEIEEKKQISCWLSQKKGASVRIVFSKNRDEKKLLKLATENAELLLKHAKTDSKHKALSELKEYLQLSELPWRIEGVDISNTSGYEATGSVVVFEAGLPKKSEYRKFKINTVQGIDDFAMLEEVVKRRYNQVLREKKILPQLMLVDGGKGQVGICDKALRELNQLQIFVVGLAKEMEQIFISGRKTPVDIPLSSSAMKLLQQVRDEAHRFAHVYHTRRRQKKTMESELERIAGIGEHTKRLLLLHFKSLDRIKKASFEELVAVPGIGEKRAQLIQKWREG